MNTRLLLSQILFRYSISYHLQSHQTCNRLSRGKFHRDELWNWETLAEMKITSNNPVSGHLKSVCGVG